MIFLLFSLDEKRNYKVWIEFKECVNKPFFYSLKKSEKALNIKWLCYLCKHGTWHCEVSDNDAYGLE